MSSRLPLADRVVERIRRERYAPRRTQPDYLHLVGLRRALAAAFAALPAADGPALDLYCGTQPYREMIPRRPVVGVDRDRFFGRADVVADLPLPFVAGSFSLAVCTQALHLADDPGAAVAELWRVVAPGGYVLATVPHRLRREMRAERLYAAADLHALFADWDVTVRGIDGPGNTIVYAPALLAMRAARRWPGLRVALPVVGLTLTSVGVVLEAGLRPFARRWPACWIVVARRPAP